MYGGAFAFQNRLGQLIVGRRFTIFALFYFVFEGKFQVQAPPRRGGTSIWRGDLTEGFLRSEFGGLIFGGGYIWRGLFSEFYGNTKKKKTLWPLTPYQDPKRYLQVHQVPRIAQFVGYCPIGQIWISYRVQCQSSTILMSSIELPIHHKHQYW